MKCLQCGNELALLKKLTNGEFCSPEHRTAFFERMQRVATERLAISAYRLNLKTRLPLPKEIAAELERARREAEKAPPFAGFVASERPAVRDCAPGLWLRIEFDNSDLLIVPPVMGSRCPEAGQVCQPVIDFLHPQSSRRRHRDVNIEFLPAAGQATRIERVLSTVAQKIRYAPGVTRYSDPVRSTQAPDARQKGAEFSSFQGSPARPDLASAAGSVSLSSLPRMKRLEGPDSRLGNVSLHGNLTPASQTAGTVTPGMATGRSDSGLRTHGSPFRMRPRGPVADHNLAALEAIDPAPAVAPAAPALGILTTSNRGLSPAAIDRPFRMRPRAGVDDPALPRLQHIDAGAEEVRPTVGIINGLGGSGELTGPRFHQQPAATLPPGGIDRRGTQSAGSVDATNRPWFDARPRVVSAEIVAGAPVPRFLDRFFRMRPRGPVDAGVENATGRLRSAIPADAATQLVYASAIAGGMDCAPAAIGRPFRMRPRGPVNSAELPTHSAVDPKQPEAMRPAAAILPLPVTGPLDLAPATIEKPIRLRPRGPVACAAVANLARSSTDFEFRQFEPMRGTLPAGSIGDGAPVLIERPFRMRPRGPVQDAALRAWEAIAAGVPETLTSAAECGNLPAEILIECAPNVLGRAFRMRPRGPADDTKLARFETIAAAAGEALTTSASISTLPQDILVPCAPNAVQRAFRMRPRGGIQDENLRAFERLEAGADAFASAAANPTVPAHRAREFDVAFLDRCFRMRPRGPVQDEALARLSPIAVAAVECKAASPAIARTPSAEPREQAPLLRDCTFAMQPRGAVLASAISRFHALPSSQLIAQTSAAGVTPLIAGVKAQLQPVFLDRVYRMRPRRPVSSAPEFLPVDMGAFELVLPLPVMPAMPAVLMRQATMSFREKPIKMKPRGPKPSSTANSQPIEPAAAEPDSAAAASCSAIDPAAAGLLLPLVRGRMGQVPAIRGDSVLRVDAIDRSMSSPIAGAPCSVLVEPIDLEGEIYAQTLSDGLTPLSSLEPEFSGALQGLPMLNQPVWFRAPLMFLEPAIEIAGPDQGLLDDISEVAADLRRVIAEQRSRRLSLASIFELWKAMRLDQKLATAVGILMIVVLIHSLTAGIPANAVKPLRENLQTADVAVNPLPPLNNAKNAVELKWSELQPSIRNRSSMEVVEDFNHGLANWDGGAAGLTRWAAAPENAAVGNLALYKPSIPLSDYRVEFSAEISKKSLGFIFRAVDRKNYYAVRMETIKSGRMRTIYLVRYTVIKGKEGPKTKVPLPMMVSSDTVFQVGLDAKEQFFTLTINGKVADFWTDDHLKTGGVGFFTNAGEQAHLQSVRVAHQNDTLGKLCSFLSLQDTKH